MTRKILLSLLLIPTFSLADERVTQGMGNSSTVPWFVNSGRCVAPTYSITSVSTATNTPASQTAGRTSIMICNSIENSAGQKVKCRIDGSNPVMGATNVGDVLAIGDCITYVIPSTVIPKCVSDGTAAVPTLECQ